MLNLSSYKLNIWQTVILFLSVLFVLAISNYLTIRYFKQKESNDLVLVDVSGRNRMLSQRIGLYAEIVLKGNSSFRSELLDVINLHDESLKVLKNGGIAPGFTDKNIDPPTHQLIKRGIDDVEVLWQKYKAHALAIVNAESSQAALNEAALTHIAFIEKNADELLHLNNELVQAYVHVNMEKQKVSNGILQLLLLMMMVLIAWGFYLFRKRILQRLKVLTQKAEKVSEGHFDEETDEDTDPYLMKVSSAINRLGYIINKSIQYAQHIGSGNFNFEIEDTQERNQLFKELLSTKKRLLEVADQEAKRKWITEGVAMFADISRSNQNDINELCSTVISQLVKYLDGNQGGIFLAEGDSDKEWLELKAAYAWGRKKYLNQKVEKGLGLVGQCWMDGDIVYMTEIPQDYINIKSGLGDANPKALLIVPLIANDVVLGVIELATLRTSFEKHQIEFIEKVAEGLASTFSFAKANEETKVLLNKSQLQSQVLSSQEQEMRENMQELEAAQIAMKRKEEELTQLLEASFSATKQNLREIGLQIEATVENGKRELKFLSEVPPVNGVIRALENGGIDPMDGSSYDIWIDRFLVILESLLNSKALYKDVQFIKGGKQLCKVSFQGDSVLKSKETNEDVAEVNRVLRNLERNELFVFVPEVHDKSFTIRLCTPLFSNGNFFGGLVISLLGDDIINAISVKEDKDHGFMISNSDGTPLFRNELYPYENQLKDEIVINKSMGYSIKISNMMSSLN